MYMNARINLATADEAVVHRLATEMDLPHFIAATLVARGIDTLEAAQAFLYPDLESVWGNPYLIEDMDAAVDRIAQAIQNEEHILVYGDFDLEGFGNHSHDARTSCLWGCGGNPFYPSSL